MSELRRLLIPFIMRLLTRLVIASGVVALIGYVARDPAATLAKSFVDRLGPWGMALGTLLADGLYFPVPPQLYMLLAVASGAPFAPTFVAICTGSLVAGHLGYSIARLGSKLTWVASRTEPHRALLARVFERYGYRAALVASLLPIPFSVLCYAAGVCRLPRRFVALLGMCRVPKLLGFYWLVHAGWS